MKIEIQFIDSNEEETLHLKVRELDDEVTKFINMLKVKDDYIFGTKDEKRYKVKLNDIYYFEAVGNNIFVYTKENVYEVKEKLYQIEEKYQDLDFVRVSKSVIVSIDKVEAVAPGISGRFEAKLDNDERIIISRSYVKSLKNKLGIE